MMPEEDDKVFGDIYRIYTRFRWKVLRPEDFIELTNEISAFAVLHKWQDNPLAQRLGEALMDVFNDLYSGGKVPKMPDYIGRSDL